MIDLYRFLLSNLPAIALSIPILVWLHQRTEREWRIILTITTIISIILACCLLLSHLPESPRYVWSGNRLVNAVAWVKGYDLYYPPNEGPVLVQMYGPVSAMVYTPAALADDPTGALLIGSIINLLLYFLPAVWFLGLTRGLVLFVSITATNFVLARTATFVTIDAPAAGLAACALALTRPDKAVLCGLFAAGSMWTKLTLAPICVAIVIYAMLTFERRKAIRFSAIFGTTVLFVTTLFILWFPHLIFQNVIVPASQPWTNDHWNRSTAYLRGVYELWFYLWPIAVLMLMRGSLLPSLAALLVLPTATLAYVKIGGIWNNAAAPAYLGLLALGRVPRSVMVIVLAAAFGTAEWGSWRWTMNDHQQAYDYLRDNPRVYFPDFPLAALMAQGKLYHSQAGIQSMTWAGFPPTHYLEHLPEMDAIVFFPVGPPPYVWPQLEEFDQLTKIEGLENWTALTK